VGGSSGSMSDSSEGASKTITSASKPLRPIAWWWVAVGLVAVATAIWGSTWWLLTETHGLHGADLATARMDAIKTGLSVGAGTGGAVALLLALRRQWLSERDQIHREEVARLTQVHSERVATASEHDASERRVTDLYVKAADQLGSDKAPVRLAGLYALERLAQDNPTQRQTIVDVLCAYLRMPFTLPAAGAPADDAIQNVIREECQVRSTAESILTAHLAASYEGGPDMPERPDDPRFWAGMNINLTGATITGRFAFCRFAQAIFNGAVFVNGGSFSHAIFERDGFFRGAQFKKSAAHFYAARFGHRAVFHDADFGPEEAIFREARFHGLTLFDKSPVPNGIEFRDARALIDFETFWGNTRWWPAGWSAQDHDRDSDEPGWGLVVPDVRPPRQPKKAKP